MKTLFLEAREKRTFKLGSSQIEKLPNTVGLFTTVQFLNSLDLIKKQIEDSGRKVKLFKPSHTFYKGQILGCSVKEFPGVDGFLFIGDGMYHPCAIAAKNKKPVYLFNPFSKNFSKLSNSNMEKYDKKKKGALAKFYASETVGILVSTKPGQNQLNSAIKLKEKLKRKFKKKSYIFIANDIDANTLESFPFIDCCINTACSRLAINDSVQFPKPVLDYEDTICALES